MVITFSEKTFERILIRLFKKLKNNTIPEAIVFIKIKLYAQIKLSFEPCEINDCKILQKTNELTIIIEFMYRQEAKIFGCWPNRAPINL